MGKRRGIKPVHYSTGDVPPDRRHEEWANRGWPSVAALFESVPIGEFSTAAENIYLDGMAVSFSTGSARRLERSPGRIAGDGIDVLGAGLVFEGGMRGTAAGRAFDVGAGEILLLDTSQPVSMTMSASRSVQLAIPRGLAEAQLGSIEALHGMVIGRDAAAMLRSHLLKLTQTLKLIREEDAPRVARTLIDMLVLAVNASEFAAEAEAAPGSALARRARDEIRQNLGSPTLTIANLCRRLEVSRSTLHRLFAGEGGVQAYIRNSRLDAARAALLESGDRLRIGELAEQLGFSDAAHLSRLFRARFGETPSECRAAAAVR